MEAQKKKCSYKEHKDINAISYCLECKRYICNKCLNYHQGFFENHHYNNLDDNKEIFIDICKEKNHSKELEFYCKDHNQLCCICCIAKTTKNEYGQHKDCNVCAIEDVKEEKNNKLKDNIKYLEDLSNDLNDSIKEIKNLFDQIDERKEELKSKVQNIFTKIRTALNEREYVLLLEIDNKYNEIYGNDKIIKDGEKLPNKIKLTLERAKLIDNDWNDKEKKEKKEGEPKKPATAFFLFCAEKRKENKDKKLSAKELGEMFYNLPEAEKEKYKKEHEELMKKYEEELALFKDEEKEKEDKKKAKPYKCDQKKSNKKACNCGKCDECKAKNKANDDEDDDE